MTAPQDQQTNISGETMGNDPYAAVNQSVSRPEIVPASTDPEFGRAATAPDTGYVEIDFWGASEEKTFVLPGQESIPAAHRQTISYKTMNEGMRTRFQKKTNRPVTIEGDNNNNARLNVDPAADRHALLEISITDWKLSKNGQPVPFRAHLLQEWLKYANPLVIDKLERAIREDNPWMINEMSSKAIQDEIDRLELRKAEAVAREESEENFGSK